MTWDAKRVRQAVDKTFHTVERFLLKYDSPRISERIDPNFRPDLSPSSNIQVRRHLSWMFAEVSEIVAKGDLDKAQRWLGFIQGVAWATGMTSLEALKEANRDSPRTCAEATFLREQVRELRSRADALWALGKERKCSDLKGISSRLHTEAGVLMDKAVALEKELEYK